MIYLGEHVSHSSIVSLANLRACRLRSYEKCVKCVEIECINSFSIIYRKHIDLVGGITGLGLSCVLDKKVSAPDN